MGKFFGFLGNVVGVIFALIVLSSCGGGAMVSENATLVAQGATLVAENNALATQSAALATENAMLAAEATATAVKSSPEVVMAEQKAAVRAGVAAYFSVNVDTGKDAWQKTICDLSTERGCAIVKKLYGDAYWALTVEKEQYRRECEVESAVRDDGIFTPQGVAAEAWRISFSCTDLNTGTKKTRDGDVYVLIASESGEWKFDHVMLPSELDALRLP